MSVKASQIPKFEQVRNTAIASVAAIAITASPQQAVAADAAAGKLIFEGNCSACHAGG